MSYPSLDSLREELNGKRVKEQCVVLFPYAALNDDELTLAEGQIINIISKDVEDKGWWKGEVDGRTGVFPDNFVKMTSASNSSRQNNGSSIEELSSTNSSSASKLKKPLRPPNSPAVKDPKENKPKAGGSFNRDSFGSSSGGGGRRSSFNNAAEENSRERLNSVGSTGSNKGGSKSNKDAKRANSKDSTSSEKSTSGGLLAKRQQSFTKATPKATPPPPKPNKPPPPSALSKPSSRPVSTTSTSSLTAKISSALPKFGKSSSSGSVVAPPPGGDAARNGGAAPAADSEMDLDSVNVKTEKLAHPTAARVKAPKRRPPSSVFNKEAKTHDDAFESLESNVSSSALSLSKSLDDLGPESGSSSGFNSRKGSSDRLFDRGSKGSNDRIFDQSSKGGPNDRSPSRKGSNDRLFERSSSNLRKSSRENIFGKENSNLRKSSKENLFSSKENLVDNSGFQGKGRTVASLSPQGNNNGEAARESNKNRLSFKLVRSVKDVFGGLTNGNHSNGSDSKSSQGDLSKNGQDSERRNSGAPAKKMPPPKPPAPSAEESAKPTELITPKTEAPKKPGWLEELSRKQTIRKSGLFKEEERREEKEEAVVSPTAESKPQVPLKPSQIKEEARRSGIFSSIKHQQRPTTLDTAGSPAVTSPVATPAEPTSPEITTSPVVASPVREEPSDVVGKREKTKMEDLEMMSLLERVRRLEGLLVTVQADYDSQISDLNRQLKEEREARRRLEGEIRKK